MKDLLLQFCASSWSLISLSSLPRLFKLPYKEALEPCSDAAALRMDASRFISSRKDNTGCERSRFKPPMTERLVSSPDGGDVLLVLVTDPRAADAEEYLDE